MGKTNWTIDQTKAINLEGKNILESYWQLFNSNSLKLNVKRKTYTKSVSMKEFHSSL